MTTDDILRQVHPEWYRSCGHDPQVVLCDTFGCPGTTLTESGTQALRALLGEHERMKAALHEIRIDARNGSIDRVEDVASRALPGGTE